jgi:hypothetical protein
MSTGEHFRYRVDVVRTVDGAVFPGEPLPDAYLQPVRDEAVFLAQRRGVVGPDGGGAETRAEPVFARAGGSVRGVRVTVAAGGRPVALEYGVDLFAGAAAAGAARLAREGQIPDDGAYAFRVWAEESAPAPDAWPEGVTASVVRAPLPLEVGRLADWVAASRAVGPPPGDEYPLFVTPRAMGRMRQFSRKPGDREGGALLVGRLYRQAEPEPEVFGVIDDALEARHAENEPLSLDLTVRTWAYLAAQLERRRTRLGRRAELALGFAHGHNFLPDVEDDGRPRCAECGVKDTCPFSSSFYSVRDADFHRALFGRQPFAVGLVWGYTSRREDDLRAYHLRGGMARRRGFYEVGPNGPA